VLRRLAQRPESAAAFAEALRLPLGEAPEHLAAGAASAVAPVVAGMPGLTPDPNGQTTFMVMSPSTPPIPAVVKGRRHRGGRPRWLVPLVAVAAALVLVVAIAMASNGGGDQSAPRDRGTPATASAASVVPERTSAALPADNAGATTADTPVAAVPAQMTTPSRAPGGNGKGKGGHGTSEGSKRK